MIDRRSAWALPLAFLLIATGTWAVDRLGTAREQQMVSRGSDERTSRTAGPTARTDASRSTPSFNGALRWILAGGGPSPELNQIQIEQDLALAREVLSPVGPGLVLFAGGPASRAVQVLDPEPIDDPLRTELGALLSPRGGRDTVYRDATLSADGPASAEAILAALEGALPDGDAPLLVYLAGHGLGGDVPGESRVLAWGPGDLWVEDVSAVLDEAVGHRPARFVITTCYSGGFAELAFAAADPEQGAATTERCGLFATSWNRTASGCDPNPDRGAQEGYGMHFLQALRGLDRHGEPLRPDRVDLDGDGVVSLLEAHTYARIESRSLDVPVTTSSRFLQAAVDADAPSPERAPTPSLTEEQAVVDALTPRLGLVRPEQAFDRLERENAELERRGVELDEAESELALADEVLAAALLHRWPLLDDPWHPRFAATLAAEREAIVAFLAESGEAARHRELVERRDRLAEEHDRLLVATAPLERLVGALETLELATRLQVVGGRHWLRYQALLACERSAP